MPVRPSSVGPRPLYGANCRGPTWYAATASAAGTSAGAEILDLGTFRWISSGPSTTITSISSFAGHSPVPEYSR